MTWPCSRPPGPTPATSASLGSKRKAALIVRNLLLEGVPEERIREIRSPVGLDTSGAAAPEEIAVSVMAEILAVKYGRTGKTMNAGRRPAQKGEGVRGPPPESRFGRHTSLVYPWGQQPAQGATPACQWGSVRGLAPLPGERESSDRGSRVATESDLH